MPRIPIEFQAAIVLSHVLFTLVNCYCLRGQILPEVWVVTRYSRSMTPTRFWGWRWSSTTCWRVGSSWRATAQGRCVSPSLNTPGDFSHFPRSSPWKLSSRPAHTSWTSVWTSWSSACSTSTCRRYPPPFCYPLLRQFEIELQCFWNFK